MSQNPTAHATDALTSLSRRLLTARAEDRICAERLDSIESDLALQRARLDAAPASAGRHRAVYMQRIAGLLELRATLLSERVRRRREIDDMAQRKEAVAAALAVLRDGGNARSA